MDFVATMTVEQRKVTELIVGRPFGAISVLVMHRQQVMGTKAQSALGTVALWSIQQEDNSFR
jgi:hypothetical protein